MNYHNLLFFRLVNFREKKYLHKIIFAQTKLDENMFTSHVWWALIEKFALRAEVKRRSLVVLEARKYTRTCGQQQLGKCLCVVEANQSGKIFVVRLIHTKYFYKFSWYENIFSTK